MKSIEVYVSGFFILVGGVIFWQAALLPYNSQYGPGPGLMPIWVSGLMIILSAVNLVIAFKNKGTQFADLIPQGTGLINLLACVGSFALFMLIVKYVGFTISSILMLFILFSRGYKWYWGLGMSIAVTAILFFVFSSILGVPLPVNEFGW
ncbi:MAG: tripartite tricarboxylate transporter TctB family protein [Negativicutes bacterium]|nr:tripartite tricarboxylate transporter TctB family protein [Negativicutes bacterium]